MLDRLPEFIDPLQLADKRGVIKGTMSLSALRRLADALHSNDGVVAVELFFGRDGRLAKIEGRIATVLQLQCQNCPGAVDWPFDSPVKLGIVTSIDQAELLSEVYEPLLVETDTVSLKDIIEDELLLSLPRFAKHQHRCFALEPGAGPVDSQAAAESPAANNPFSVLAALKNTGDYNGRTKE